ncbi:pentatricopeptide repeat-containing protein DOT4, chloroplastic-like [Tasmannia lanceolata]|uniref:pentatricopeptide repeat-containing protein DOT4, chloroplastic-like n=1 Tax=Tasmannia lanceolata TaxID=3420 RepID=UPI0040639176
MRSLKPMKNLNFPSSLVKSSNTHFTNSTNLNHDPTLLYCISLTCFSRVFFVLDSTTTTNRGLEFADQMFDKLLKRNVISWTATISRLARTGGEKEAIGLFKSMLLHGERPNYVTFLSVIRAIGMMRSNHLSQEVHAFVIKMGFESEISVVTALLGLYSSHGIANALQLFNQIDKKDLILWSAMVAACSKNGQFSEAIENFRKMQCFGINNVSLVSVLPACAYLGALLLGKQIHGFSIKREFFSDTNLQNSLVDMYAKCGKLDASRIVFDGIPKKDLISWKIMIFGCSENRDPRQALAMFLNMRSHFEPDEITVRNALAACSQMKELSFGSGLHCYLLKSGFSIYVSVGTELLRMYADFSEVETSKVLFDELCHKDLIAWSVMISVYARAGHPDQALGIFKQMHLENEKPNEITLVSLLKACSSLGAQVHGKTIHAYVIRVEYSSNAFLTSSLIDFYCKLGRIREGRALFDKLFNKDLICWSSMINGYGMNGCGSEALETFSKMLEYEVKPNDAVFTSVLSACSHCGLVDEGWKWFYSMKEDYGISPTLLHYACIVDLLSRRGEIEEALKFIQKMPLKPDASIWGALLAGCRTTGSDIGVMELAAEHLFELNPHNTSYYVILSNLYAENGRWGDVERLRNLVKEKKLRKAAGCSMIETKW